MPNGFKGRHFPAEFILLCVRWYLKYSISYRQLAEMMEERGFDVHYTTIYRWIQTYAPQFGKADPVVSGIHNLLLAGR